MLTEAEITEVMDRGDVVEGNRFLPFAYARAIEAKIEAKLREQEQIPVIDLKHTAYDYLCRAALKSKWIPEEYMANDWLYDCAQYLEEGHPAPIPEGWQLVPIEPTDKMWFAGVVIKGDMAASYKAMLAAARGE